MPKVTVDGVEIEVPQGATVLRVLMLATSLIAGTANGEPREQPNLGRVAGHPTPPLSPYEDAKTRQVHALFGACVVKRHRTAAVTFVLQPVLDLKARTRLVDKLSDGDCLIDAVKEASWDIMMRLPGDTMRYTLADALVRAELPSSPIATFASVPPLTQRVLGEALLQPKPGERAKNATQLKELADNIAVERGAIFMSGVGECVVRTDPLGSFALLSTAIGSAEETNRLKALVKPISACIPADRKFTLDKTVIRGTVAYNYYRLAKAPRATAPGAVR